MYIKIFFEDKPLFLTDAIDAEIDSYMHHDDAVFMDELSAHAINAMIHEMRRPQIHAGIYYSPDLAGLKKAFFKKFHPITAAGGVVANNNGQVLLIYRRNKWDLPKGKAEEGESLETCAVREIREETGLKEVVLERHLLTTYHTYEESGKHLLKDTHWYLLSAPGKQQLEPQLEEDITKTEWVSVSALSPYMKNSYSLIADVLAKL